MKRFFSFTILLLVFFQTGLFSQSFYEIKWNSGNIDYTAFLVYYDMNDVRVRVKYRTASNVTKIAEFKCKGKYTNTADGQKHFLYDGENASIVYSSSADNYGYNADNFIFTNINDKNQFEALYAIDDDQLTKSNYQDYFSKASFRVIDPKKDFSQTYLKGFFQEHETLYKTLVKTYVEAYSGGSANYRITAMAKGDEGWTVIMSKNSGINGQSWRTLSSFPADWVKEKWGLKYRISSVAYGDGEWAVTMSENTGIERQTYHHPTTTFPATWIKEKWDESLRITSLAHGKEGWLVVMSQNSGITQQTYMPPTYTFPAQWISDKWKESYRITSIAYGTGGWCVVMSKDSRIREQSYKYMSPTFPKEWITEKWGKDYDITSITHAPDGWAVIMTQGYKYSQTYQTSTTYPSSWIQSKWDGTTVQTQNVATNNNPVNNNNQVNNNINNNPGSNNVVIHLITVADTRDPSIGASCKNDLNNMVALMHQLKNELNVELKMTLISELNVTKSSILSAINNLKIGRNDVVFFYYSGHGYNLVPKQSDFPYMSLSGEDYKLEDAYNLIRGRNPRLTLVIGDLCNSIPRNREGTGKNGEIAFKSSPNFDYKKLSRLFLQARGSLISTSSSYNEFSYSLPDGRGEGAFTKSFIASFMKEASILTDSPGDWKHIFNTAYTATLYHTSHLKNQNSRYGQNGFNYGSISY